MNIIVLEVLVEVLVINMLISVVKILHDYDAVLKERVSEVESYHKLVI